MTHKRRNKSQEKTYDSPAERRESALGFRATTLIHVRPLSATTSTHTLLLSSLVRNSSVSNIPLHPSQFSKMQLTKASKWPRFVHFTCSFLTSCFSNTWNNMNISNSATKNRSIWKVYKPS